MPRCCHLISRRVWRLESIDELFKLPESSGDREVQIRAVTHRVRGKRSEVDTPQDGERRG